MARLRSDDVPSNFFDEFSRFSVGLDAKKTFKSEHSSVTHENPVYQGILNDQRIGKEDGTDLYGWSELSIDRRVEVRMIEGRGRCLFSRVDLNPGDIVFVENPTFVAIKDFHPELFKQFEIINNRKPLELPPVWHFAALCVLTMLPRRAMEVCLQKWVPDSARTEIHEDTRRIFEELPGAYTRAVSMQDYEIIVQAWRFNSFGHHSDDNGLVLYDRTSMMSHSCSASCCWHYGYGDSFVLRARTHLRVGDELTISYIGDDDLQKSTDVRRDKLAGWLFNCTCNRCCGDKDACRSFRCQTCGVGSWDFKQVTSDDLLHFSVATLEEKRRTQQVTLTEVGVEAYDVCTRGCQTCGDFPDDEQAVFMLGLEKQYIERLDSCSSTDPVDLLAVWTEAEKVFTSHWVLLELMNHLKDIHTASSSTEINFQLAALEPDYLLAAEINKRRMLFFQSCVSARSSYSLAWSMEEQADILIKSRGLDPLQTNLGKKNSRDAADLLGLYRRQSCIRYYEDAYNMLLILVGAEHEYSSRTREKWQRVLGLGC